MKKVAWILMISLFFNSNLGADENSIVEVENKSKPATRFLSFAENSKQFSQWCTSNFDEQEQKYINNPIRLNFFKDTYNCINRRDVAAFLNRSRTIDNEIIRLKKRKNISETNLKVLEKLQVEMQEAKKQKLTNWLTEKVGLEREHAEKIQESNKKIALIVRIWEKAESKDRKNITEAKKILKDKLTVAEKQIMMHPLGVSEEDVKNIQLLEAILSYLNNIETEQQLKSMNEAKAEKISNESAIKRIWRSGANIFSKTLKIGMYTVGAPIVLPFMAVKKTIETGIRLIPLYKKLTKSADERNMIDAVTGEVIKAKAIYKVMGEGTKGIITALIGYISVPAFVLIGPGIYNWLQYREFYSPTWDLFKHYALDKFVTYKMKLAVKTFLTTGALAIKTVGDDLFKMLPEKIKFGQKDVLGIYRLIKGAVSNKIDTFSEILTIYLKKDIPVRYRLTKMNEKFWDALLGNGFHNWITDGDGREILEKAKIMPVLRTIGGFYKWLYYASGKILKTVVEAPFFNNSL